MSVDVVVDMLTNAVMMVIWISAPMIGMGLLVGLVISIFQAVTQIQEQTLTFVPKMIVVFLMLILSAPWFIPLLIDFTVGLWANIPIYTRIR